jgi:hypothetical protein
MTVDVFGGQTPNVDFSGGLKQQSGHCDDIRQGGGALMIAYPCSISTAKQERSSAGNFA